MNNCSFIPIQESSIPYTDIVQLYSQLTSSPTISACDYQNFINSLCNNQKIYVMQRENQLVGLGTLFLEHKLIHGISTVGHIEDIVISKTHRGKGYGKQMIDFLTNIAKESGCYKVLLNCAAKNIGFYEKCGYSQKNVEMSLYFS